MLGKGLLKGMGITFKHFLGKKVTVQYPEEKIPMSPRFRGGDLELNSEKCIACGLCSMACPNAAIALTTVMNEQKKKRLASYIYHSGRCLYCNLCVEACPTKAIHWDQNYENSRYFGRQLDVDCLAVAQQEVEAAKGRASDG
ncbi:MAG: NADH-quinone oxidoreductase subunit I [Pelosinus sp.]|nr:NADH-quinone oxidoreductase subunit I [Pelosinus sp.]